MSDESIRGDVASGDERLEALKDELFKHFGKLTRWKALCVERDATTVEEQIRLAEEVLAASSTGTVAEWYGYHLRLQGKTSFDVDEYLAGRAEEGRGSTADAKGSETSNLAPERDGE
jgi:hypothetical protein